MDRYRRFREAVVVSQEPFQPNRALIRKVLAEMGVVVTMASSAPASTDTAEASAEPPSDHVRGTEGLLGAKAPAMPRVGRGARAGGVSTSRHRGGLTGLPLAAPA